MHPKFNKKEMVLQTLPWNGPRFRGESVRTHALTPKSGYLSREFPESQRNLDFKPVCVNTAYVLVFCVLILSFPDIRRGFGCYTDCPEEIIRRNHPLAGAIRGDQIHRRQDHEKLILLLFSFALLLILVNGCASTLVPLIPTFTPEPAATQQASDSRIPILVPRFYSSEGLQIRVGMYSGQLGTGDLQELTLLAQEMAQQKDDLTPEQMFVLAIRLYDLGEKDNSVYWFYEAQFRAKLFRESLDADHIAGISELSSGLLASYDAFTELGKLFPDAVFVERSQWQGINDEVAAGLGGLIDQLSKTKEAIRLQRAANNLDARFCQ